MFRYTLCFLSCPAILLIAFLNTASAANFSSDFASSHDRVWIGPQYWANPMEDWRIQDGRLECISGGSNRNVQLLTRQLGKKRGGFTMSVHLGLLQKGKKGGSAGFRVGIRDKEMNDYRTWLIYGSGWNIGITSQGTLFIAQKKDKKAIAPLRLKKGVILRLRATPDKDGKSYTLQLSAHNPNSNDPLATLKVENFPAERLIGNIALVNNHFGRGKGQGNGPRFWFADWKVTGDKVEAHDDHAWGPILWSMHTLSRGVLKMTAQMPPVGEKDAQTVRLQIRDSGQWKTIGETKIAPLSYTATFRIAKWNDKKDIPYRIAYSVTDKKGKSSEAYWTGTVRKDPVDKKTLVVGALSCNADYAFPNAEIAANLKHQNPDMLFFAGDQIYEYVGGYGLIRYPVKRACLNYLRKWYLFGMAFGDLMRDRVTVCIPDDHDVYQGNIWGNGGNAVTLALHDAGGYVQHRDFVNCVHRTQSSHLPDPYDPAPIAQGVSVYYGPMVYGRVGFAIIADRMFKSGPRLVATWKGRPDHLKDPKYDVKRLDKPGLNLLGKRQEKFLRHWVADWEGVDMKCILSQTNFCNVANYHGAGREYLVADLDSGGWPQTARNRALAILRKGFAFHLCGDQHLTTIVHYGIDEPGDAGVSFCVPAIANFYPRRWIPDEEGKPIKNRRDKLANTGDYVDGLGNPIRVLAVGNPEEKFRRRRIASLHDKASGFGLVRFNRDKQTITMESYRLLANPNDKNAKEDQFPGWPLTIRMTDNYGRKAKGYLPTIKVKGMVDPVVQIVDEKTKEMVYTLRIKGTKFRPKVFGPGPYTVTMGELGTPRVREFRGVRPTDNANAKLEAKFDESK